ncbi:MAG: hypothetical protein R3F01_01860 [Lysobacteraceae bacterium]
MKPERSMAFVGVTDTISLRIRQQVRRIEEHLTHDWKWVSADNPDLVFIDPDSDEGKMARGRAKVTGMRYIEVIDEDMTGSDAPTLRIPIRHEVLIELMNNAGTATVSTGELAYQNASDFYFRDLEDQVAPQRPATAADDEGPAQSLDEILRHEELAEGEQREQRMDSDAEVSAAGARTGRTKQYANRSVDRGLDVSDDSFERPPPVDYRTPLPDTLRSIPTPRTTGEREASGWPLPRFLGEDGPTRPSRYAMDDAPILYIDPKSRQFSAEGDLSSLDGYCRKPLNGSGWNALTTAQLNEMRQLTSRSYDELTWLYTWLNGDGRLSAQLDPGGSYRVPQPVSIDPNFRQHRAIVTQMQAPARLHEIAANAGVSMDQVFDLVNAYHAIGALEWTRRAPREPSPGSSADRSDGLLKRLWPFKR